MLSQRLMIKNLIPSLIEWGKIKIGRKGKFVRQSFQMPEKLDHFLITTMERDDSNNFILDSGLMDKIMTDQKVDALKSIPITLLYNDIELNLQTRYACFRGKTRWCTGDGEEASRLKSEKPVSYETIKCPCERAEPDYAGEDNSGKGKCKVTGCLSCLIDGSDKIGGVWKFRTTSFNSARSMLSSLLMIKRLTGGIVAGIPLHLTVSPKSTNNPVDGQPVTIYVVNIEYHGNANSLRLAGLEVAKLEATHSLRIERIEEEARQLLITNVENELIDDDDDHVEEFHPEEVATKPDVPEAKINKPVVKEKKAKKETPVIQQEEIVEEEIIVTTEGEEPVDDDPFSCFD
jgi:hypothetical protein